MDGSRFDALTKTLGTALTRRGVTRLLGGLSLGGVLVTLDSDEAAALLSGGAKCTKGSECKSGKCLSNSTCSCSKAFPTCKQPSNPCKKATCDFDTKKCVTSNKKNGTACGSGTCQNGSCVCGSTTCASGQVCCKDLRCGRKCCANGRACNTTCCGLDGNNYCCPSDRPVCVCGTCGPAGSTQCDDPTHCCGPNQKCCGSPPYHHCCDEGWECWMGCGGVAESATCCKTGAATCCGGGHRVF